MAKFHTNDDDLFEFPCEFPLKVMGKATEDFDLLIVEIVRRHCHDFKDGAVRMRSSKSGKYLSVTVTITAQSRAQLDALYTDLSRHEQVMMVL
ncbi:MAG: DUF493 domain-containing protein [Pseudomonadota bacterium]